MKTRLEDWFICPISEDLSRLPKLIIMLEGAPKPGVWVRFLDELARITKSSPAQWPHKPWYDRDGNDEYPLTNEKLTHRDWGNPHNQKQLRQVDSDCLIPAEIADFELQEIFKDSNIWADVFLNRLPDIVGRIGWILYGINEDWMFFLTTDEHRDWVDQLQEWCLKERVTLG